MVETYEILKKIIEGLNSFFPSPEYQIKIRGSWGVYIYSLMYNEQNPNNQDKIISELIDPNDLDILLCYPRKSKHDTKLNDSIKRININIGEQNYIFTTTQRDVTNKTFTTNDQNIPINSIDIYRCGKISKPNDITTYDGMNLVSINELFDNYSEWPEFDENMTDEQKKNKLERHQYKQNIVEKIKNWMDSQTVDNDNIEKSEYGKRLKFDFL